MSTRHLPILVLSAVIVALAGCTAKSVRCDTTLTPINAPAARGTPTAAPVETGP